MIKNIIFDFDGTLFDSMIIWEDLGERFIRKLGKKPKENLSFEIRNMSMKESATYLQQEYDINLSVEEIISGINKMLEDFYINEVLPKEGVVEFLEELNQRKVSMCIATATDKYLIEAALKRCNIKKYFKEIFTCGEVGENKYSPKIYREALKFLNGNRMGTLVFEDAVYAAATAKEDGFKVVSVYDKSEEKQELLKEISDFYLKDFLSVDSLLREMEE